MPILVVNHSHRSQPKPRLRPWEPLGSGWTGLSQPPVGADRNPPRWRQTGIHFKSGWMAIHLRPGRDDHSPQAKWKVIHSLPEWWTVLLNRSGIPAASGGPPNRPPGREGAGDWHDMYMHEMQGMISEPPAPPYPVGTAEVRREAIGHIYD